MPCDSRVNELLLVSIEMRDELERMFYYVTGNRATAQDLVQEVHLKLLGCDAARIVKPRFYIRTAAKRMAINWSIRNRRRWQLASMEFAQNPPQIADSSPEEMVSDEQFALFALSRLPPACAQVVVHIRYEGLSVEDTARKLHMSINNVKAHLRKATRTFAQYGMDLPIQSTIGEVRGKIPEGLLLYPHNNRLEIPSEELIRDIEPQIIVASEALAERLRRYPQDMHRLRPREFERLVFEILRDRGYEAHMTPETHDGGADVLAYFDSDFGAHLCLVETKRYAPDRKVGFGLVQRLYGAFASYGATCAMLVTTSSFTKDARDLEQRHQYQLGLRDYADLLRWLAEFGEGRKDRSAVPVPGGNPG